MTNSNDFIWWHKEFVYPVEVLVPNPCWTLYTLDRHFAYFVLMPEPWSHYHARRSPFVFMCQFKYAMKLARMPLETFCQFSENLPQPKGPVIYYTNAARSGTTLLTRVMQVSEERIVCFSEPDTFTALAILQQRGYISDEFSIELLRGLFKYYCKDQNPNQTYLMKTQSNGVRLVPFVKKAMPQIKHMFTFRCNTRRVLTSLEKILRGGTAADVILSLWNISQELAFSLISYAPYEYELCKRFGMKDCLDFAIIHHVSSFYHYYKNKDVFDIPIIYYEDLISDKEKTLKNVFDLCQLPYDEFIEDALQEFQYDSQAGTVINQTNMLTIRESIMDENKVEKMNYMCDQLGIPRIDI